MYCYVGVLSTDSYLDGILVLNENLKRLNSKYKFVCLINEKLSKQTLDILNFFGIETIKRNYVQNNAHTRWKDTFDKINVFSLTEYDKIVYLDSDFLILENLDHLFSIDKLTMNTDYPFYEDKFNSSLMVIKPNFLDYMGLIDTVNNTDFETNNYGDQDIINIYFKEREKLDPSYNMMRNICDKEVEVLDKNTNQYVTKYSVLNRTGYVEHPKIIHYIMGIKPFMINKEFDDEYYHLYMSYLNYVRYIKELYFKTKGE